MKTLKKIQLKDAAVLSHHQLKQIRGGSGAPQVDACRGKSDGEYCKWYYETWQNGTCYSDPNNNYILLCRGHY